MIVVAHAYARAGLIGNPSDGYFGKTITITFDNFHSLVKLFESPELRIELSLQDHSEFDCIEDLVEDVRLYGYYGGVRLIKATVKKFWEYCRAQGIVLERRNFTIRYSTTVPRGIGLAGSSAIITATLRALMTFYRVSIPKPCQPTLILSVETEELGISAGLQDRVAQVYEGVVYMDFDRRLMEREHRGRYRSLDPRLLPKLFVAYRTDLAQGSEVFHNNIRDRFDRGEERVVNAMKEFAALAKRARDALLAHKPREIGPLMDANFDLRASIYKISRENHRMVRVAREAGASAKFSGSGGAVIGTYRSAKHFLELEEAFHSIRCEIFKPRITR